MYTSGAKQYWIARSVKHEKKRELQVSLTPKKGPHTLHSVKYKSLQKRRWKFIHYFNYQGIIKAKEHVPARTLYRQEKKRKTNIKFIMYCIKINFTLVQVYSPFTRKW